MSIYLDHNATTALDPRVWEAMRPHFLGAGNAESRHTAGRRARRAWDEARETVAKVLNAAPDEVVFTSGGTEANNLALFGLTQEAGPGRIISSPIEHPSIAEPLGLLEDRGFTIDRPDVSDQGLADAEAMASLLDDQTRLTTLMLANNETGAIQPVARLAELAASKGVPVHTDAVQAVGRVPVDFRALGVATLAASAHKFHGPVGVGVLLVREGVKLAPQLIGGGQQKGRRPGTVAVPLAVGLAKALDLWRLEAESRAEAWRTLAKRLENGIIQALGPDRVVRNGPADPSKRLPQTVNLGFIGLDGDAILMQMDLAGVSVSLGSACASGSTQASPTLQAMRIPPDRLRSSVRFSLGAFTTEAEVDQAISRVVEAMRRLRNS